MDLDSSFYPPSPSKGWRFLRLHAWGPGRCNLPGISRERYPFLVPAMAQRTGTKARRNT
jgi:hypothetical protein